MKDFLENVGPFGVWGGRSWHLGNPVDPVPFREHSHFGRAWHLHSSYTVPRVLSSLGVLLGDLVLCKFS